MYPITTIFGYLPSSRVVPPHTGRVALYLTLIGLGWLLAVGSGTLWLRENPGRPMRRRDSPKRSWRSNALYFAAIMLTAYGGRGIQRHQHSESFWIVVAVVIPLVLLSAVIPSAVRWWQLRHSARQPSCLDSSAEVPPTA
jgi:hypothetical protein